MLVIVRNRISYALLTSVEFEAFINNRMGPIFVQSLSATQGA